MTKPAIIGQWKVDQRRLQRWYRRWPVQSAAGPLELKSRAMAGPNESSKLNLGQINCSMKPTQTAFGILNSFWRRSMLRSMGPIAGTSMSGTSACSGGFCGTVLWVWVRPTWTAGGTVNNWTNWLVVACGQDFIIQCATTGGLFYFFSFFLFFAFGFACFGWFYDTKIGK